MISPVGWKLCLLGCYLGRLRAFRYQCPGSGIEELVGDEGSFPGIFPGIVRDLWRLRRSGRFGSQRPDGDFLRGWSRSGLGAADFPPLEFRGTGAGRVPIGLERILRYRYANRNASLLSGLETVQGRVRSSGQIATCLPIWETKRINDL